MQGESVCIKLIFSFVNKLLLHTEVNNKPATVCLSPHWVCVQEYMGYVNLLKQNWGTEAIGTLEMYCVGPGGGRLRTWVTSRLERINIGFKHVCSHPALQWVSMSVQSDAWGSHLTSLCEANKQAHLQRKTAYAFISRSTGCLGHVSL